MTQFYPFATKTKITLANAGNLHPKQERDGRGERRGGSRFFLLTDWVSVSEPFLSFLLSSKIMTSLKKPLMFVYDTALVFYFIARILTKSFQRIAFLYISIDSAGTYNVGL